MKKEGQVRNFKTGILTRKIRQFRQLKKKVA
jgi:hypothetical protein